ncbi:hypothetical protein VDG1235_3569 [Verrucomicrobiia bacterium DG1235]|nr:hypothetical protein VDG1235_3569 [Verrucomicrobiae bacterium DG1235]
MKNLIYTVLLSMLLAAIPSQLFAGQKKTELFETIAARKQQFAKLYNEGDSASLSKMFTQNATVVAPNFPPDKGRKAIKAGLDGELAMGDCTIRLETLEVSPLSDASAYEIGYYHLKIVPEQGDDIVDEGHYVVVWKLGKDKVWRLQVDTWNTSLPL